MITCSIIVLFSLFVSSLCFEVPKHTRESIRSIINRTELARSTPLSSAQPSEEFSFKALFGRDPDPSTLLIPPDYCFIDNSEPTPTRVRYNQYSNWDGFDFDTNTYYLGVVETESGGTWTEIGQVAGYQRDKRSWIQLSGSLSDGTVRTWVFRDFLPLPLYSHAFEVGGYASGSTPTARYPPDFGYQVKLTDCST